MLATRRCRALHSVAGVVLWWWPFIARASFASQAGGFCQEMTVPQFRKSGHLLTKHDSLLGRVQHGTAQAVLRDWWNAAHMFGVAWDPEGADTVQ